MKLLTNVKNHKFLSFFVVLVITVITLLIAPAKGYAAPLVSTTFPNPAASTTYPLYMTVGTGEFDGSVAAAVITSDTAGAVGVIVEEGHFCNLNSYYTYRALDLPQSTSYSSPYFSTNFAVYGYSLGANTLGSPIGSTSSGFLRSCDARTLGFTFVFGPSNYDASTGKYSALFLATVGATNPAYGGGVPGAAENSFRISVGGPGNVGVSFLPSQVNSLPSFFNMSNRNRPTNSVADYNLDFTLPCSVNTAQNVSIQFGDADNGVYQQSASYPMALTFSLSPGIGPTIIPGGNGTTGAGLSPVYNATLQPGTSYTFRVAGLSYINAITYSVAIPSALVSASNNCPTETAPIGYYDGINCSSSTWNGWAFDPDASGNSIQVHIYIDGNFYTGATANQYRGDVNAAYGIGGNHGFSVAIPDQFLYSNHTINVYALGVNSAGAQNGNNPNISNSPNNYAACPPPLITIQGRLFDAENMAIPYPGITIETCTGQYPVTDGNGFYSFVITRGTAFCIRAGSWPQYAATAGTRPWAEGYYGCAGFDQSYRSPTNYCTQHSTYECQTAGYNAGSGCGIAGLDRTSNTGYDIVFTIQKVTVQGIYYNAYNMTRIPNVQMSVCGVGTVNADGNGYYSFIVKRGSGYCIRPSGNFPAGYAAYNIRPYTPSNYGVCTAFSSVRVPNYCPTYSTYECQLAGVNGWPGCGTSTEDRTTDVGQDFVFRFPPQLSCTVGAEASFEVGTNYVPNITVYNVGGSGRPPVETGNIYLTINGVTSTGDFTPSNQALISGTPISTPGGFAMVPANVALPSAQNYPITAGFSPASLGSGDGIAATNNGPCGGATFASRDFRPYVKVFGSDVSAGGGFITSTGVCPATTGRILAFSSSAGGYRGSSGQFGVAALMNINEFYSASQRTSNPVAPKGLSFRNNVAAETYGGNFGGGKCIPDYYGATQDSPNSTGNIQSAISIPSSPTNKQYILTTPSMGSATDITIGVGRQKVVYYDGNIYIDRNIIFSTGGRTTREDIPYFALIVRGNIYIAPSVSRLDGVYIAQPHTGMEASEGRIYTCAAGAGVLYTSAQLATACNTSLAINGALIAQQVKFLRTLNSLRDSTVGELPNFIDGSQSAPATTRAAEIINYTPEIYMAPSPLKDPLTITGNTGSRKPDAIFSLPPVF